MEGVMILKGMTMLKGDGHLANKKSTGHLGANQHHIMLETCANHALRVVLNRSSKPKTDVGGSEGSGSGSGRG
eukprot:12422333-Karenia_brevis.AAC.1